MKAIAYMKAFSVEGTIREITVPDEEINEIEEIEKMSILDLIYRYGQNDFQHQECYSVSVGDVIFYNDKYIEVKSVGFEEITQEQFDKIEWQRYKKELLL